MTYTIVILVKTVDMNVFVKKEVVKKKKSYKEDFCVKTVD